MAKKHIKTPNFVQIYPKVPKTPKWNSKNLTAHHPLIIDPRCKMRLVFPLEV